MTNDEKSLEMLYELQKGQEELQKGQEELKADIADLKEKQEDIQTSVNAILGWTDKVSEAVNFPLPRI